MGAGGVLSGVGCLGVQGVGVSFPGPERVTSYLSLIIHKTTLSLATGVYMYNIDTTV